MKLLSTLIALVLLHLMITPANSGHSRGNNTCEDDKLHHANMIVNGKRSDAPLYDASLAMRDKAHAYNNYLLCEKYMEEALRMIRKTNGEYPTE